MDLERWTDTIATAGAALTGAGRREPSAAVAACPGWTVGTLVGHVGAVHAWAAEVVRSGGERPASFPTVPEELFAGTLADWADERRTELLATLAETDPDSPAWAFGPVEQARFWWRRQANETAVHAWDATAAAGDPWTVPAGVAIDALEEMLEWFLPRVWKRKDPTWGSGRTVHLHRTDGDGEWLLTIGAEPQLVRGHAKGDLAVRGTATDLMLWSLNRPATVELFGDSALADAWAENVRL